jgi:hypothetical protein
MGQGIMQDARAKQELRMPNIPGAERWTSPGSEVIVWMPSPTVMRFKYFGFSETRCVGWMETTADKMIRENRPPIDMFVDCWDQVGYETGFRTGLTAWNKRIKKDIRSMSLLIRSKIAAMGITVANLTLGGLLVPCTDPQKFESEINLAIARGKVS